MEQPSAYEAKKVIKKMTVEFSNKDFINEDSSLLRGAFFLELLMFQRPKILLTKKPIRFGRLMKKKNEPVGVSITLRRDKLLRLHTRLVWEIFPKLKKTQLFKNKVKKPISSAQFAISDLFSFKELQPFFFFSTGLKNINFNIIFTNYRSFNLKKKKINFLFELQLWQFNIY